VKAPKRSEDKMSPAISPKPLTEPKKKHQNTGTKSKIFQNGYQNSDDDGDDESDNDNTKRQAMNNEIQDTSNKENTDSTNVKNFEKDTELQQLRREKYNLETMYKTENHVLQLKINALEEDLTKSQHETKETQRKLQTALDSAREENMSTQDRYQSNITSFQREIKELTEQLCQKEKFIKELVAVENDANAASVNTSPHENPPENHLQMQLGVMTVVALLLAFGLGRMSI